MSTDVEQILCVVREVFVFKIPPQSSAAGHRADSWPKDPSWTGKLVVYAVGENAAIKLIDTNSGSTFAECPIQKDGPESIQKTVDSSRYYVLRIVNKASGRHAFIGLAFDNRNDAFDFNVCIDDHKKRWIRDEEIESTYRTPTHTKDFSLKEGETIRINLKKPAKDKSEPVAQQDSWKNSDASTSNTASISGWETFS